MGGRQMKRGTLGGMLYSIFRTLVVICVWLSMVQTWGPRKSCEERWGILTLRYIKGTSATLTLSKTMHEQSGIHNVWDDWLTSMFGQWKDVVASLLISMATFAAILVTCGCCCIPCLRALSVRLISSAIEKREPPGFHMMPLLGFGPDEDQDETVFQK